jgi:hypothetical protein
MPGEHNDWILEPTVILLGCQPWPPRPDPNDPRRCPVCGHGIKESDHGVYCCWEDRSAPPIERRCLSARIGHRGRTKDAEAQRRARDKLKSKRGGIVLPESERRRIWLGCRGDGLSSLDEITNRAKIGRDWLLSIGQAPDWDLVLDKRGNIVGRRQNSVAT